MSANNYANIQQNIGRIWEKYHVLYRWIFINGAFLISCILAVVVMSYFITFYSNGQTQQQSQKILSLQITQAYNNFFSGTNTDKLQSQYTIGGVVITGNSIYSYNNLALYDQYILPKIGFIDTTITLTLYSLLASGNYTINDFENILKRLLFHKQRPVTKQFSRTTLPITKDIASSFNISCVLGNAKFSPICWYYLNEFLNNFFMFNLKSDYAGLYEIFNKLEGSIYKQKFCETLQKYVSYTHDTNTILESIFANCWPNYIESFNTIQQLLNINEQIDVGPLKINIYKNNTLNVYKLISFMQEIYNELEDFRLNARNIETYNAFIQEILRKDVPLDTFYYEAIYWFNNYYLQPKIVSIQANSRTLDSSITMLIENIQNLNNGSDIIGYTGLMSYVRNQTLIDNAPKIDISNMTIGSGITLEDLVKQIEGISFYRIIDKQISEPFVYISGYMLWNEQNSDPIFVYFSLERVSNSLLIRDITLSGYTTFTNALRGLIAQTPFTISSMFQYIQNNIYLYQSESTQVATTFCDRIKVILAQTKSKCTEDRLIVRYNEVLYTFDMENYKINNITISDIELEQEIKTEFTDYNQTNELTLPYFIDEIINYQKKPPASDRKQLDPTNNIAFLITERLQKFGLQPTDIAEENGKYYVGLFLQNIQFNVIYDVQNHIIGPLYFENVLFKKRSLMVRNFSLTLDENNRTQINEFSLQPLEYIKKINKPAYDAYIDFMQNK